MDPLSWATIALTFVGAQVAQKATNGAIETVWERFTNSVLRLFEEPPSPDRALTASEQLLANEPELAASVGDLFEDSVALRRARLVVPALEGARVLWVDDAPANNEWERALLRALGVHVTAVTTTLSAVDCLQAEAFDIIISDIVRGTIRDEGVRALPELRAASPKSAILFYVGHIDASAGTPNGANGVTNRPDELLHLVLDALERRRL